MNFEIIHHGAKDTVTGSCHEIRVADQALGTGHLALGEITFGILIDCGLKQGREEESEGGRKSLQNIDFPINHIAALVVTHVHLDHVGRIPHLLAAGFKGPIICSEPSAKLLPLVLEDAVKVAITRDRRQIERFIREVEKRIVSVPYGQWHRIDAIEGTGLLALGVGGKPQVEIKFRPAGHILGSAFVEVRIKAGAGRLALGSGVGQSLVPSNKSLVTSHESLPLNQSLVTSHESRITFSGDLGAPYAPLLPAPKSPYKADIVVLESTYGDRLHEGRKVRRNKLRQVIERCLENRGAILVPAFAMGRTQELLYELEEIIHANKRRFAAKNLPWPELEVVLDSPLASRFTATFRELQPYWDAEAHRKLRAGRRPLGFEQITAIDSHQEHLQTVEYLKKSARPCIVIASSGMCSGGRIVNYLKALLPDERTDVLFVGYQAAGTPGRDIQKYGPGGGYVYLDGKKVDINAGIHTIGGYSAHADQQNLVNFVKRMRIKPAEVRLVHGEMEAKAALAEKLAAEVPGVRVLL